MFRLKIFQHATRNLLLFDISKEYFKRPQYLLTLRLTTTILTKDLTSHIKLLSHVPKTVETNNEQEYLVRLKNDPDTFGDSAEKEIIDEMDLEEEKHFEQQTPKSKKLRTKQYADMIKDLIRRRKIKEAIDVLEVRMLQEDQVKPESYIYNLLLGACGRVGYTKKAFSLYNQMKKRGLKVVGGTYTALFNACANSPWPEDGLARAKHLRNIMIEKMYEPNDTNYNAMIKAFGRCGDLTTSFSLVDEMLSKKIEIKDDTFNFLLQACIQDKEAGFRHAILVWRKMIDKNIKPSLFTFNLILRSIRDCGFGDVKVMQNTLESILNKNSFLPNMDSNSLIAQSVENEKSSQVTVSSSNDQTQSTCLIPHGSNNIEFLDDICRPNLMAKVPHLGNIISLSEITKAEDRLLLVGGMKGFIHSMINNNCPPDIKSFTQMLDCLPGNISAEKELQTIMKKMNVKPDIDFFNMLIKKRSMRFDYENAKAVLEEMKKFNYKPNVITYGVLALGCKTKDEAVELITEMKSHSYRLNTEILGAMLHQACSRRNFPYVLEVMEISLKENVKPNKIFMECLEDFKKKCKYISNDKENKLSQNPSFLKSFRIFKLRYKSWLQEVEVENSEETHPWTQYRQHSNTDTRHYKDKSHRFQPKHLSRFKVKTSTKHK